MYNRTSSIIYILIYVDGIIITGSNDVAITDIIHRLQQEFAITNLGSLTFFRHWSYPWWYKNLSHLTQIYCWSIHKIKNGWCQGSFHSNIQCCGVDSHWCYIIWWSNSVQKHCWGLSLSLFHSTWYCLRNPSR